MILGGTNLVFIRKVCRNDAVAPVWRVSFHGDTHFARLFEV